MGLWVIKDGENGVLSAQVNSLGFGERSGKPFLFIQPAKS